jgi:hypothetical protein
MLAWGMCLLAQYLMLRVVQGNQIILIYDLISFSD